MKSASFNLIHLPLGLSWIKFDHLIRTHYVVVIHIKLHNILTSFSGCHPFLWPWLYEQNS
jgi:hypothetical protein